MHRLDADGSGVAKDRNEAIVWFRKSAFQGASIAKKWLTRNNISEIEPSKSPVSTRPTSDLTKDKAMPNNIDEGYNKLKELKELKNIGILTNKEYELKRRAIVEKM